MHVVVDCAAMSLDIVDIRDFYASSLGQMAARMIRHQIRAIWPEAKGQSVLGLGYATPYLNFFRSGGGGAARVLAAMPASQGVLHWPADGPCLTTLADEADLPFPDLSIDRVLLIHALETTEQVQPMMREIWRVLSGSGRLLVVAPNRRGIWARLDRTPFGYGQPYSSGQLSRLLRETMFTPVKAHAALFAPPSRSRMVLASARAWEGLGQRGIAPFAGVVMIEATKQIYAGHPVAQRRRRAYLALPQGPRV
ncbi:class I SAM-dependent methyltransferase [Shumkonia mesophila]|uniref:class I SAM-dependent methyltransferase n=1 Tax=Shumkonia mesophila TaxID=2838854 RepID=UPI00293510C8|nr:methyltransferase domain-containing protein [Shumkonia mesophila]